MSDKEPPAGPIDPRRLAEILASVGPEDDDPESREVIQHWERNRVESARAEQRVDQHALLQTSVSRLRGREHAARLADRHNQLLISDQFIAALEMLRGDPATVRRLIDGMGHNYSLQLRLEQALRVPSQAPALLAELFPLASEHGFFVSRYSEDYEAERLGSDDMLITEGSIPAAGRKDPVPIADCQIRIARTDATVPIIDLPDQPTDHVYEMEQVRRLQDHPGEFAVMEDIACEQKYDKSGYAGVVRNWSFSHIRESINAERRAAGGPEIRQCGAAIAGLLGIVRPDGGRVLVSDVLTHAQILNQRSVMAHERSRFAGQLGYTLDNRLVPYQVGAEKYQLLVRWFVYFQPIAPSAKK